MNTIDKTPLARESSESSAFDVTAISFGTDGWRAIIGEDFTAESLARVVEAAAKVYREDNASASDAELDEEGSRSANLDEPACLYVGYDCRQNAHAYAALAATILSSYGFKVILSNTYCPTPALCWSIAQDLHAVGGLMLTSSHNPAEYLGVKLRMADGGASPKSVSDRVEAALQSDLPGAFDEALVCASAYLQAEGAQSTALGKNFELTDLVTPYLSTLSSIVDGEAMRAAGLRVVVDPMFGAGRGYLAGLLKRLGVEVVEIHATEDPSFAGLHPEPILPWIAEALAKTAELGYDACLITDGDADRIGAGSSSGAFVNPHMILALLCAHLVEDKGASGCVVRTLSGSNLIKRQCQRLDLELITTPIGFKWIYEEMLKGDVMLGGEESGGIGIPSHVRERDGLLMALLLVELMAKKGKDLGALVEDLFDELGRFEYARRDLRLTQEEKERFLAEIGAARSNALSEGMTAPEGACACEYEPEPDSRPEPAAECEYACQGDSESCADDKTAPVPAAALYKTRFDAIDEQIISINFCDGIKFDFASDAWLLARPSGTEPLVRVYAEATTTEQLEKLLTIGCALVKGETL